ncbi:MAG: type VI secretion system tube protein Hcp [Chitinophagaceae bacterium]
MKKKLSLIFILVAAISQFSRAQSVGIGTNAPSANAILDITSTNKGIMLPRVNDTTNVTGPSAGLLIFNKNTKSLNFYDGGRWQNLSTATLSSGLASDSLVYQTNIAGGVIPFYNAPLKIASVQYGSTLQVTFGGGGGVGKVSLSDLSFSTELDNNYIPFLRANHAGTALPEIEFRSYKSGTTILKYSTKLSNIYVTSVSTAIGDGGQLLISYSLSASKFAYKDWVSNKFFTYDIVAGTFSTSY